MHRRIGLNLAIKDDQPRGELVEFVKRLEALGYDSVWTGESWGRELFGVLTHLACHTSHINLGAGIANVFSRTPGLVAQSIATLDEISNGRAILGLGSSGRKVINDWHGIPFEKPLQRTREYVEIAKLALSGERVNYAGEFFQMKDFRLGFKPVRNHVPIFIAALGPENVRLTGELADGWAPLFVSYKHLERFRKLLGEGAALSGRPVTTVHVRPYVIAAVSDDVREAKAVARSYFAFYIGGMGRYYRDLVASYGYVEETARIAKLWGDFQRDDAASAVPDSMLEEMAVVGTAEECRQQIMDRWTTGMGDPILYVPHGASDRVRNETVEALSPKAFR